MGRSSRARIALAVAVLLGVFALALPAAASAANSFDASTGTVTLYPAANGTIDGVTDYVAGASVTGGVLSSCSCGDPAPSVAAITTINIILDRASRVRVTSLSSLSRGGDEVKVHISASSAVAAASKVELDPSAGDPGLNLVGRADGFDINADGDTDVFLLITAGELAIVGSGSEADRVDLRTLGKPAGKSIISTLAGNDIVHGSSGPDEILLGPGDDRGFGGPGRDSIDGGSGHDLLHGGAGRDFLYGRGGNDRLVGGTDDDALVGDAGNDRLFGQAGDDNLNGGYGNDRLNGGIGDDGFYDRSGATTVSAGPGADSLRIDDNQRRHRINCGAGNDRVIHPKKVPRNCEWVYGKKNGIRGWQPNRPGLRGGPYA